MICWRSEFFESLELEERGGRKLLPPFLFTRSVTDSLFLSLCSFRYVTLLNKCYVADSGIMRWCPAPNCEHAVECGISTRKLDTVVPSVQCTCGEQFCYGCGNSAHQPAICKTAVRWLKKCEDDSETVSTKEWGSGFQVRDGNRREEFVGCVSFCDALLIRVWKGLSGMEGIDGVGDEA